MTAIRPLTADDWPAVSEIYAAGIATGDATFEAAPPGWVDFDATRRPELRLVAEHDGAVVGWIAATPTSAREVYRGVVEHSVYVSEAARGRGIGRALLDALLDAAPAAGVWTVQSSVFPENSATRALHRAAGFREVGHRERIGRMTFGPHAGRWRDTILIERRL